MRKTSTRQRWLRFTALTLAGLYGLYLLLGWLAFEPLVQWWLPKAVAERSGYRLQLAQARFNPFTLNVDVQSLALAAPDGAPLLALQRLQANLELAGLLRGALELQTLRLERPLVTLDIAAGGSVNWQRFFAALARPPAAQPQAGSAPLKLRVGHLALEHGRISFADHSVPGGFNTQIEPLDLQLDELSTRPDANGRYTLDAGSDSGARLHWRGTLALQPLASSGDIGLEGVELRPLWPYLQRVLHSAPPEGRAALKLHYELGWAQQLSLRLADVNASVQALQLRGAQDNKTTLKLDSLTLAGGRLDLATRRITLPSLALHGGHLTLVRAADGSFSVQRWFNSGAAAPANAAKAARAGETAKDAKHEEPAEPTRATSTAAAPASPAWQVSLVRASVDAVSLQFIDQGFVQPLQADVAQLELALGAEFSSGAAAPRLAVQGLDVQLGGVTLKSGAAGKTWFELAQAQLQGGVVKLAERELGAKSLRVSGGSLAMRRDTHGAWALLQALEHKPVPGPGQPATRDAAPWHYRVERLAAEDFKLQWQDDSVAPAVQLTLNDLHAEAGPLSNASGARVPLQLGLKVASGGSLKAGGTLMPSTRGADLRLSLQNLALAPLSPYLAQVAELTLSRGQVQTSGRLRVNHGEPRYGGDFALSDLQLDGKTNHAPFLAWKRLSTPQLVASLQRLDVGQLELAGLDGKLIIYKDRSINLARVLRPRAATTAASSTTAAAPAPKPAAGNAPYEVNIGTLRVVKSELDFSDLSLSLPFAARIHALQGEVSGLSTRAGSSAELALAGQVDAYGLARAAGRVKLLAPTDAMHIQVHFQNIEMTSLTPYSATFAGRKIESGKLSLDLDYRLEHRQLLGDNKIVMDRLTLGEHVASAGAMNLPLDLALALLKDNEGRIELGLPVSGSLDDPQFSYSAIVWKAIKNVVTKLVTAPFRALGALLGGGGNSAGQAPVIAFDAGAAQLLPPEREKLDHLVQMLQQRRQLVLKVSGGMNPRSDAAALQRAALERAVARELGREPAEPSAGALPAAINTSEPAVQQALATLYAKAFGDAALREQRKQHEQRAQHEARDKEPRAKAADAADATDAATRAAAGAGLYASLAQQLLAHESISPAQLQALATQRADVIKHHLQAQGLPAERVQIEPASTQTGSGDAVNSTLGIGVVGAAAGAQRAD